MDIYGFSHQIGGHFGILKASANCVCKPLNQRELTFYSQLSPEILPYTPKFYGKIPISIQTAENGIVSMRTDSSPHNSNAYPSNVELDALAHSTEEVLTDQETNDEIDTKPLQKMIFRLRNKKVEAEHVTNLWASQCQSKVVQKLVNGHDKYFILLEDVVSKFSRPCVVDLKMGTRQYGQNSSEEKRLSQQQKCRQSTSEKFGVRMVGMQLYDKTNKFFHYVNKYEGRRMNSAGFNSALTVFLVAAGVERTKRLLAELEELKSLMYRLEGYRFFSSSLLIGFDGSSSEDSTIVVRMIDFAHSTFNGFMEDRPYTGIDDGYILGINSLLKFTNEILDQMSSKFLSETLVLHPLDETDVEISTRLRKRKHDGPVDSDTTFQFSC